MFSFFFIAKKNLNLKFQIQKIKKIKKLKKN
jgi:hypothetical protein